MRDPRSRSEPPGRPLDSASRHPTVRDIAAAAGVSQSTAARALSGRGYVSRPARTLVIETADRLRYVPNNVARSLRAQATGAVGVLISDLANPFYAEVARGIEQVLRARGYQMLLADSDGLADQEAAALRTFQTMRVEGVILTPATPSSDHMASLVRGGLAVVEVDRLSTDGRCDGVVVENEAGAYQATRHLLELGHQRVGLIVGETTYRTGAGRLEGYIRALADAGILFDEELVAYTSFHAADAQAVARDLLRRTRRDRSLCDERGAGPGCAPRNARGRAEGPARPVLRRVRQFRLDDVLVADDHDRRSADAEHRARGGDAHARSSERRPSRPSGRARASDTVRSTRIDRTCEEATVSATVVMMSRAADDDAGALQESAH